MVNHKQFHSLQMGDYVSICSRCCRVVCLLLFRTLLLLYATLWLDPCAWKSAWKSSTSFDALLMSLALEAC